MDSNVKGNKWDRYAKQYVLLDANDCTPPHSLDMESEHDSVKVEMLVDQFRLHGFDQSKPALVGYPGDDGKIQLLSGTHRHEAARITGIKLPVTLILSSDILTYWGTDKWKDLIEDIPVKDLECAGIPQMAKGNRPEQVNMAEFKR